ncbi:methionyl-tRNA formyltransferase, mitochondrial-like isoform X2 [Bemisia tabaci]
MEGPPWRILFFGSDDFSLKALIALTDEFKRSEKLISKLDLMFIDDESVAWKYANEHRLNRIAYPPESSTGLRDNYDIGVVASFGAMLRNDLIKEFPLGILNAHPSLLPRWRGASPIPHAIMHGDTETGVTIMKIKPDEFDTGDILMQTRTKIGPHEHTPELLSRLADESANLVLDVIKDLPKSVQNLTPQGNENATYAPLLKQEMTWILWKNWTAEQIYNRHRGLSHLWPVSTIWKSFVVKLHNFTVIPATKAVSLETLAGTIKPSITAPKVELNRPHNLQALPPETWLRPGLVMFDKSVKALRVMCVDGAQLLVPSVTVSGRKTMDACGFHNGFLSRTKPYDRVFNEYSQIKGEGSTKPSRAKVSPKRRG